MVVADNHKSHVGNDHGDVHDGEDVHGDVRDGMVELQIHNMAGMDCCRNHQN